MNTETPMYFIQVTVDTTAAARHVATSFPQTALKDPYFVLKTAITEALGGPVVRPWRLHRRNGRLAMVLGYSDVAPDALKQRLDTALPSARQAIDGSILGYETPSLQQGQQFRFLIRMVPTIHVTPGGARRPGERDAYLVAADDLGSNGELSREEVYAGYLADRFAGVTIDHSRLDGFRINSVVRKAGKKDSGLVTRRWPIVDMSGLLTVQDPHILRETLRTGVGRQRAFGYGMVLLQPFI